MIELPLPSESRRLREFLKASGYTAQGLENAFGTAAPPPRSRLRRLLHDTREPTPLNTLVRLFLIGLDTERRRLAEGLPEWFVSLCREAGFLELHDDSFRSNVVIVPRKDLLFVSDAFDKLASEGASEFVSPASTHAAGYLLNVSLRNRVDSALDMGTGCGVQALFAAGHSKHVVATDISHRAIRFAELNASLNDCENVEFLTGDLFDPVAGKQFDLIVANPPFVVGPSHEFTYRDSGYELDGLSRKLVREAPDYLTEGGILQMLCEWVEVENEPWRERLQSWFEGLGCDAWVLRSVPHTPAAYTEIRLGEVNGPGLSNSGDYEEWMSYFEAHKVKAIQPGLVVMRRRQGRNWMHVHNLAADVTEPAGQLILESIAACDFLDEHAAGEKLLEARLRPSPHLRLEQVYARAGNDWTLETLRLRLPHALPMEAELDPPIAALLNKFEGSLSVEDCIRTFAREAGADVEQIRRQCMPVVRVLIERGFLLPV